jgi:hypothetical protein
MKFLLRFSLLVLLLSFSLPVRATSVDENLPDAQALAQLELRAMTELAGRQMLNGDIDQASATLKKVNYYAQLIHFSLADNAKRIKNAEMLMHHTTFRLGEYLHKASSEDQDTLKATLKQLDQVHAELLTEVLKH